MRTAKIVYSMAGWTTVTITGIPNDWDDEKVLKEWQCGNISGEYEIEETDVEGELAVFVQ